MYRQWRFFQALIDNAELALAKADIGIAGRYALLDEEPSAERLREMVSAEFNLTRGAVLMIIGQPELLGATPWLHARSASGIPTSTRSISCRSNCLKRLRHIEDGESAEALASATWCG